MKEYVQQFVPNMDSPEKVYELFHGLGYPADKILDPTYKRKIEEFEFAQEEREKIKTIYTVFNYDSKLQVFLVEAAHLPTSFVKYLIKRLSDRYLRFLLILTVDYGEYTFVLPEFEQIEEGKHRLKLTKLIFDRKNTYHTDLLTISNIALTGQEKNWKDIWLIWEKAFSVKMVTGEFFDDYKKAFFELRETFESQKISVKNAHEIAQQFLSRLMFLYFLSKKRWLNNDTKFIKWYWMRYREERKSGGAAKNTFYENWIKALFLEAFNNNFVFKSSSTLPHDVKEILAEAPYLNGGLFHKNMLDDLPFHISDDLFEKVLEFFEKYNFTIREDLPLEVEVAVDPQMIGYVYESLSNVAEEIYERQDLGIFYTPTVEVDFMCRRSLVEYLTNHIIELPKEQIYKLLFDEDKKAVSDYISKQALWYKLEETLDNLAVIDPACGSGAFLVGMLHVLVELYKLTYTQIKREITEFELKKKIIGNSLYGVDVMPWAVHSAELRLWLQLIIEENIPYEQRKLYPLLPNLNLKLRVGDSLVQEVGGINLHLRDSRLSPAIKRKLLSLKTEKEKYYNNDPTARFKNPEVLLQEELRIFGEILGDRIITLGKEIQNLEGERQKVQMEMFDVGKEQEMQKLLFEDQIKLKEQEIKHLQETVRTLQMPGQKPFVWDIDFAEIFGDKGGFDIVIGNPPYVRQEKIAPPNKLKAEITLEDRQTYKEKLLNSIHYPFVNKINRKSDLYIYFYFHGLSLLNESGTFCFITSNSWLDVDYGKELQEFLLKYCNVKAIYDNEAKRSFKHADVNTIIALLDAPHTDKPNVWPALNTTARFVMFKKPFEEVTNTKNLLAIEKADSIRKTEAYRIYPVKQEVLFEEGWTQPEEDMKETAQNTEGTAVKRSTNQPMTVRSEASKQSHTLLKGKFISGKYEGNKWGGKYLRAPDIFFTILEKGKDKLVRLGDIAEVKGYIHDNNTGDRYPKVKFIKSVKQLKCIIIDQNTTSIVNYGVLNKGNSRLIAPIWFPRTIGERQLIPFNSARTYGKEFYKIIPNNSNYSLSICIQLNSTFAILQRELLGLVNLGDGALKFSSYDITLFHILKNIHFYDKSFLYREQYNMTTELGIDPAYPIREQKPNPLPDRKALDDIVFDVLGLTQDERNEVYWAVCELVHNRLTKAKSI
jgi:hypothetical protein